MNIFSESKEISDVICDVYTYPSIGDFYALNLGWGTSPGIQSVLIVVLTKLVSYMVRVSQCSAIGEQAIVRLQDGRAVNCSTVDGVLL